MESTILILIGFLSAFIGTLAGSGGLIGMPSMLLLGIPVHSAVAAAKFSNIFSSLSSFIYLLRKREISLKDSIQTLPFGLAGGATGALLANSIPEKAMTMLAVSLLVFALVITMLKKPEETGSETGITPRIFPSIYFIGAYDGLFGPGQGTLLMYTFLNKGFHYIRAVAFSRFQTFISCFASFTVYLGAGSFQIEPSLCLLTGSLLGAHLAVRAAGKINPSYLKRLLHGITILLIIQLSAGLLQ
ncbi:sulfite exporter TauE/SafE family protein [Bacillus infantis]|uniref:sulfite exporter TauE/SafE family protein n=1 Tax=Bacillus infantis TaxID=324767 RepID=UPI001CD2E878|nr:sulfite exporter TauE/SafE family protein [Bacillus infantis]MCA1040999.1 sulfite exporter TauE/SafE family protein [Bacillus infantis]